MIYQQKRRNDMKYRILKKEGEIVELDNNKSIVTFYGTIYPDILIRDYLIGNGWIEEVKQPNMASEEEDYVIICDKCFDNKDIEEKTISIFGGGCYKCGTRIGKKCGNYHCITKENYIKHFTKPREFELHLCSLPYGDSLVRIVENGKCEVVE